MKEQERTYMIITNLNETVDDMVFWAFRYFLGRQSIAASCYARSLAKVVGLLDEHTTRMIRKELVQYLEHPWYKLPDDIVCKWRDVVTAIDSHNDKETK